MVAALRTRYHCCYCSRLPQTIDAAHAGNIHRQTVITIFETSLSVLLRRSLTMRLFLLSISLLSLGLGTLLAGTGVALLGTLVPELPVGVLGGLDAADGGLLEDGLVGDGEDGAGEGDGLALLGGLDVLSGGVTALGLAVTAGEEDKLLPVLLEALDVGLEALLGEVLAAGVDRDTDGGCELAGDASSLQLSERETTTGAHAAVVCTNISQLLSFDPQQTYT